MNSTGSNPALGYQFCDAAGVPYASGYVVTKLAGLSTLAATFADVTLSTPNANSVTLASTLRLDSAGRPTSPMFFSPVNGGVAGVSYDVYIYNSSQSLVLTFEDVTVPAPAAGANLTGVLIGYGAPSTLTISGGAITPTKNFHLVTPEGGAADNLDTIAVTGIADGAPFAMANTSGSAAITIRHNVGNVLTYNAENIILSATRQVVQFIRSGATFYQLGAIASSLPTSNDVCNGRLTLTSGVPVPTADQSGARTLVYFTPYKGESIDLYNPSSALWERLAFSELSRAVPAAANGLFDCFVYNNGGTAALWCDVSQQWTNNNTRSIALALQDGVYVMSGSPQYRYVGTIATSAVSGRAIDTYAERKVYNYYNRVRRPIIYGYADATWSYNVAAFENWNGNSGNGIELVQGVVEDSVELTLAVSASPSNANQLVSAGFAAASDPTNLYSGSLGLGSGTTAAGYTQTLVVTYCHASPLGLTNYSGVFKGTGSGTVTWTGVNAGVANSGIAGSMWG